ncbi:Folate carrier and/or Ank 2 domain containing protein, partial [Asbolus verrucosus]
MRVAGVRSFNRLMPSQSMDMERNEANSSPDLGIESDHGRFSSLETHLNVQRPLLQTLELTESMSNLLDVENNQVQEVVCVDDDNNTKLHYAAALGNYEEAQKEIAFGRKLDSENYLGWTPLMMAIRNGNMAIVTLLLERGADATKRNKFGMNVFLISVASGDLDILEKILNHLLCGGISRQSLQKTVSPISLAIMFSHPNIFKYLIERSFDVNTATPTTGITPLMFAAAMSNHKAIKKLLQHKADMRQKNYLGKTASEIIESRNQRIEIDNINKQKPPHLPVIVISPHTPNLQLTPYTVANGTQNARKSSNTRTPNLFCTTPNVFFGGLMATEIMYHASIYVCYDTNKNYLRLTSYIRAVPLASKMVSALLAQIIITQGWLNYEMLAFLGVPVSIQAAFVFLHLPLVFEDELTDGSKISWFKSQFKKTFDREHIPKWALWSALSLCGYAQVSIAMQHLWKETQLKNGEIIYNGAVEGILALVALVGVL